MSFLGDLYIQGGSYLGFVIFPRVGFAFCIPIGVCIYKGGLRSVIFRDSGLGSVCGGEILAWGLYKGGSWLGDFYFRRSVVWSVSIVTGAEGGHTCYL